MCLAQQAAFMDVVQRHCGCKRPFVYCFFRIGRLLTYISIRKKLQFHIGWQWFCKHFILDGSLLVHIQDGSGTRVSFWMKVYIINQNLEWQWFWLIILDSSSICIRNISSWRQWFQHFILDGSAYYKLQVRMVVVQVFHLGWQCLL